MRRAHTKSRRGCQQCKQRKIKCDELTPACRKCAVAGRRCSYLVSLPALPTPAQSTPSPIASTLASTLSPPAVGGTPAAAHAHDVHDAHDASAALFDPALAAQQYSMVHLELLDHLRTHFMAVTRPVQPDVARVLELAFREGLQAPYLMDQLLALAAAHKSTVVDAKLRPLYRTESARLQTRALAHVNLAADAVTDDNSLALFVFSTVLGHHVLFDALSSPVDLSSMLNKLGQCFDLHHGIRVTASKAWARIYPALHGDDLGQQNHWMANEHATNAATGAVCDTLLLRLQQSALEQHAIDEYSDTVKILQYLFDSVHSLPFRTAIAAQEWLVRVSQGYITLFRQRQPEALIVLAYYAVLLHYARDYWAVGNSGSFLIHSISSHLGDYWADWLAWPKQELERTQGPHNR
jgi:hypothetical protein